MIVDHPGTAQLKQQPAADKVIQDYRVQSRAPA